MVSLPTAVKGLKTIGASEEEHKQLVELAKKFIACLRSLTKTLNSGGVPDKDCQTVGDIVRKMIQIARQREALNKLSLSLEQNLFNLVESAQTMQQAPGDQLLKERYTTATKQTSSLIKQLMSSLGKKPISEDIDQPEPPLTKSTTQDKISPRKKISDLPQKILNFLFEEYPILKKEWNSISSEEQKKLILQILTTLRPPLNLPDKAPPILRELKAIYEHPDKNWDEIAKQIKGLSRKVDMKQQFATEGVEDELTYAASSCGECAIDLGYAVSTLLSSKTEEKSSLIKEVYRCTALLIEILSTTISLTKNWQLRSTQVKPPEQKWLDDLSESVEKLIAAFEKRGKLQEILIKILTDTSEGINQMLCFKLR